MSMKQRKSESATVIQSKSLRSMDIFVIFQNQHLEHHASDGSILAWKGNQIIFISNKGIKNVLSLESITKSESLTVRVEGCIQMYNQYSSQHVYYCGVLGNSRETNLKNYELYLKNRQKKVCGEIITKTILISQFTWKETEVEELDDQPSAFCIFSDHRYARLILHSNLYTVSVFYLQHMNSKNLKSKNKNLTKTLLQKYQFAYTEFPDTGQEEEPAYEYIEHMKQFCIFTVPRQWKYPLHLLWRSLIAHKVFKHQFCYLEFSREEMLERTVMPKVVLSFDLKQQEQNIRKSEQLGIPVLGKNNHLDLCEFIVMDSHQKVWFDQDMSIFYDGFGFWTIEKSLTALSYRCKNKAEVDQQYHPSALPFKIRFPNEPQRSIQNQLKLFISYYQQNLKSKEIKRQNMDIERRKHIFDNEGKLLEERNVAQIGVFKAYSNGIIAVKFVNKCILTLNCKKMEVKVIDWRGESYAFGLSNTHSPLYQRFQDEINYAVDFQDQIFYPQEWNKNQQARKQLNEVLEKVEMLQKINQIMKK